MYVLFQLLDVYTVCAFIETFIYIYLYLRKYIHLHVTGRSTESGGSTWRAEMMCFFFAAIWNPNKSQGVSSGDDVAASWRWLGV